MKREKYFWKKLFCFVFLFTVVTGCGSVYAAEHGTVEEKETEDRSGMLEDELEQMEESLLDEFDFRQIDQLSGETELGEKVRFRDLTEMLISGNTKELGERFLEFFSGQVFSAFSERKEESGAPAADYSGGCIFLEFYKYLSKQTDSGSGFLYFVSCCDRNLSGSISIDEFICRRKNRRACPIDAGVLPKFLSGGCIYRKEQFGVDVL